MPKPPADEPAPNQAQHSSADFEKKMIQWTRSLSIATIILAIATLGSNFFIWKQWRAAVDVQNDSREQLRAYVTYEGGSQIINDTKEGHTFNYIFAARFHNWGGD